MRVYTRGDMDGLTSAVFLTMVEKIDKVLFAHPKDVQDGLVEMTEEDIITNLPYVEGCGMWFDHHVSEDRKLDDIGDFKGKFAVAPSTAQVIYDYYKSPDFDKFKDLLEETNKLDSGNLSREEVLNPQGWILLGLTLDPRTGLGPEFRKYFRWLVEYIKEVPLEKVLQHYEVNKRCERVLKEQKEFLEVLKERSRLEDNVIITELREIEMREAPVGNRFLVYTLFPEANVEARIFKGIKNTTVVAVGHSIFNRTCSVNVGEYLAKFGGGGHRGAGTCQLRPEQVESAIPEIIEYLKGK